ncbi:hypothetical protein SNEBB_006154 [Seison nebaliae]|nr:hypothetical protein SNEBB_006154 [Seison nebaliae]
MGMIEWESNYKWKYQHSINEKRWLFSQLMGTNEEETHEADIVSTVEFNQSGQFLATGDKGGRIVIFQKQEQPNQYDYQVYTTFRSHEPEFDYLKSLDIEEKINKIKWIPQVNYNHMLLSTNDKTIKLWKVSEKTSRVETLEEAENDELYNSNEVRVPKIIPMNEKIIETVPKRIYANAHAYHINSLSMNNDSETFLSADDLRVNICHLEHNNYIFNVVDIKPTNMEELTEVITCATYHPQNCNTFAYASSRGCIRLCDMREKALCDQHSKLFEEPDLSDCKSFFREIISSISDVKFSSDGQQIFTRDYISLRTWDVRNEKIPLETYKIHEHLRCRLCSLYENDCIFDKFELCSSPNDNFLLTGSYNNFFKTIDRTSYRNDVVNEVPMTSAIPLASNSQEYLFLMYEASRSAQSSCDTLRPRRIIDENFLCTDETMNNSTNIDASSSTTSNNPSPSPIPSRSTIFENYSRTDVNSENLDYQRKIVHCAWHPTEDIITVATVNSLFIYRGMKFNENSMDVDEDNKRIRNDLIMSNNEPKIMIDNDVVVDELTNVDDNINASDVDVLMETTNIDDEIKVSEEENLNENKNDCDNQKDNENSLNDNEMVYHKTDIPIDQKENDEIQNVIATPVILDPDYNVIQPNSELLPPSSDFSLEPSTIDEEKKSGEELENEFLNNEISDEFSNNSLINDDSHHHSMVKKSKRFHNDPINDNHHINGVGNGDADSLTLTSLNDHSTNLNDDKDEVNGNIESKTEPSETTNIRPKYERKNCEIIQRREIPVIRESDPIHSTTSSTDDTSQLDVSDNKSERTIPIRRSN